MAKTTTPAKTEVKELHRPTIKASLNIIFITIFCLLKKGRVMTITVMMMMILMMKMCDKDCDGENLWQLLLKLL